MSDSFVVGGREFKCLKVDAIRQFHIVRRIGPILSDLVPGIVKLQKAGKDESKMSEAEKLEQFAVVLTPLMEGFSKLKDEDADYVLMGLLSAVEMKQAQGNWMRVAQNSFLMVQDMDLAIMMQLAGRAFMHNLSGFFAALPAK